MPVALTPLLRSARMPLFAISPDRWDGPAFIGEVGVRHEAAKVVHLVQFVYLDDLDGSTMGAQVSNLDAREHPADPIRDHVLRFVARFDARAAATRGRIRKVTPFGPSEFSRKEMTLAVAGETKGAVILTHRSLPLQLARVGARVGDHATDLGIVAWRLDVRAAAEKIDRIDPPFAATWDARAEGV